MKNKLRILILVIGVLFVFTPNAYSQKLLLKNQELVITLGNSITELGEKPDGYVSIMRKILNTLYPEMTVYIVNTGISGHKSTDMNERFQRDVLQHKPDWVTISVGVNDVWHGFLDGNPKGDGPRAVKLPLFKEKVMEMVTRAQLSGIKVALFTATIIKEDLSSLENQKLVAYNNAIRKIATSQKCLLIDMDNAFHLILKPYQKPGMSDHGILTYDGVHMLPAGNWLMAKTALMAFGVPEERIDAIKPFIENLIEEEKKVLEKSLARYEECNFEVGMPRESEKRVVFYGSSSVDIWNLAKDFPTISFLNRGIGGETTRQMVMRFHQDVLNLKPYAAIIFYGSCNDFWQHNRMNIAETKSNTIKMVRMAQMQHIKIGFGAISPVNDYLPGKNYIESHPLDKVKEFNEWLKYFCEENNHIFIGFYTAVVDSNGKLTTEYTDDGMHCNTKGYAQWKPLVIQTLKNLGTWQE